MATLATARQIDSTGLVAAPADTHPLQHGDAESPAALPAGLRGAWWRGWIAWATAMREGGLR